MLANYIVALFVLMGSGILPSTVHAGSSRSSDSHDSSKSSDSKDNNEHHCQKAAPKQEAIENKIKCLKGGNQPFPTCTCGFSGTICKIDIFNANSGKSTTLLTCSGCTGPHVPITNTTECKNVPDVFRPVLKEFCQVVHPRCKNITLYRCDCPEVSTTEARITALLMAKTSTKAGPVTSTPVKTTTSVPQPPVATQSNPTVITTTSTPVSEPGFWKHA